jgi:hypothetical protein
MKFFRFSLLALLILACQQPEQRYTQNAPEIDIIKAQVADYEQGNWDTFQSRYADTAKIYHNTWDQPMNPGERMEDTQQMLENIASYSFMPDRSEYEMVLTDDGETWVNFWGIWKGTLKANGQEIHTPVHITARFIDGKIVTEWGYWDNAPITMALQAIAQEAAAAAEAEEESAE